MTIRVFAKLLGIIFVVIGIAGFVPVFLEPHPFEEIEGLAVTAWYGRLFGLFPVNWLHNLVHLAFGVWGLAAGFMGGARLYLKVVAVVYAVLAIMGLIPLLRTTFGLIPLYGHDIWLHALIAVSAGFIAWVRKEPPVAEGRR